MSVGIEALIKRAAADGTSIVIEGVHVVPGFFDLDIHGERIRCRFRWSSRWTRRSRHLTHFAAREPGVRPAERYAQNFENIRKLQRYIKSQALSHGVPIVPNHSFDQAISAVLDLVMERATARAAQHAEESRTTGEDGVRLFLDTASIDEIREINRWGVLSGVTTNPSLVAKENADPEATWKEILAEVEGDISLETTELEAGPMFEEGQRLAAWRPMRS